MKIDGTLTTDGRFAGSLALPKEEQAEWLKVLKAAQPADAPIQKVKRLVFHSGEIETDLEVPVLGTVTADVKIVVEDGG